MFGMSMVMMPIMTNGLNELPSRMNPHGTALNNTLSRVSGAIGSAVMITFVSQRTKTHGEELAAKAMQEMSKTTTQPTPEAIATMKEQLGMQAMLEGINDAFLISVGIVIVALVLAAFVKRAVPPKDAEQQTSPAKMKEAVE